VHEEASLIYILNASSSSADKTFLKSASFFLPTESEIHFLTPYTSGMAVNIAGI